MLSYQFEDLIQHVVQYRPHACFKRNMTYRGETIRVDYEYFVLNEYCFRPKYGDHFKLEPRPTKGTGSRNRPISISSTSSVSSQGGFQLQMDGGYAFVTGKSAYLPSFRLPGVPPVKFEPAVAMVVPINSANVPSTSASIPSMSALVTGTSTSATTAPSTSGVAPAPSYAPMSTTEEGSLFSEMTDLNVPDDLDTSLNMDGLLDSPPPVIDPSIDFLNTPPASPLVSTPQLASPVRRVIMEDRQIEEDLRAQLLPPSQEVDLNHPVSEWQDVPLSSVTPSRPENSSSSSSSSSSGSSSSSSSGCSEVAKVLDVIHNFRSEVSSSLNKIVGTMESLVKLNEKLEAQVNGLREVVRKQRDEIRDLS